MPTRSRRHQGAENRPASCTDHEAVPGTLEQIESPKICPFGRPWLTLAIDAAADHVTTHRRSEPCRKLWYTYVSPSVREARALRLQIEFRRAIWLYTCDDLAHCMAFGSRRHVHGLTAVVLFVIGVICRRRPAV